jgi:hypothetical protein
MNFKTQSRLLLMQAAALARADEWALRLQKRKGPPLGLIVAVHETPRPLEAQFRQQLEWVSRHFTITSLEAFVKLWEHP